MLFLFPIAVVIRYFLALKAEAEPKFQKFTSGLIPGTDPIIGVRIPKLRTLAKKIAKEDWIILA